MHSPSLILNFRKELGGGCPHRPRVNRLTTVRNSADESFQDERNGTSCNWMDSLRPNPDDMIDTDLPG